MNTSQIESHNSGYRLPTQAESLVFTGSSTSVSGLSDNLTWGAETVRGLKLPPGSATPMFLPVAGGYNNDGATQSYNGYGYYWNSTAVSSTNAHQVFFELSAGNPPAGNLNPTSQVVFDMGDAIRCVKTTP
jgi:hypothetical protein